MKIHDINPGDTVRLFNGLTCVVRVVYPTWTVNCPSGHLVLERGGGDITPDHVEEVISRGGFSILCAAYKRGRKGSTFATHDEMQTPGYDEAWSLGKDIRTGERVVEPHTLIGCGCPRCRVLRIHLEALKREERSPEQDDSDLYDDQMDGDHQSALASCGWGTDEDYGSFDGGDDW